MSNDPKLETDLTELFGIWSLCNVSLDFVL